MQNEAFLQTSSGEISIIAFNKLTTVHKDHPKKQTILYHLMRGEYREAVELADRHQQVFNEFVRYAKGDYEITKDMHGKTLFNGKPLGPRLGKKAIQMLDNGMPLLPFMKFLEKLQKNPDPEVADQVLDFLALNDFLLSEDGDIISWKKVYKNRDGTLTDLWTKNLDYTPPRTVTMPREAVDSDPKVSCSAGLHFATWDFTYTYGGDTVVEIFVNPRDVVSVPTGHRDKGRCCTMHISREISGWQHYEADPPVPAGAIFIANFNK